MWLIVYSNDHAPLTVRPIYFSSKLWTAQMMIFSLVAMIGLEKCCITSACLQWLCHSGERTVACGPLVCFFSWIEKPVDLKLSRKHQGDCFACWSFHWVVSPWVVSLWFTGGLIHPYEVSCFARESFSPWLVLPQLYFSKGGTDGRDG